MKGYLSRNPDGRYVISRWRPVKAMIYGTETEAFFPLMRTIQNKAYGDSLWVPDLCPAHVRAQLRKHGFNLLEPGDSVRFDSLAFLLD